MNASLTPTRRPVPNASVVAFGPGWAWPAALVTAFVALVYLPAHSPDGALFAELVATVAAVYVIGLSVVAPRLLRGVVLRLAGAGDPIVILGRGPDPLSSPAFRPRWRLGAVLLGALLSFAAAILAAAIAAPIEPASYGHAIASLAVATNLVLAAGIVVLAPGFSGWVLLLALVDALRTPAEARIRRTARLARTIGFPLLSTAGIVAALVGDPMLALLGLLLAMMVWTQSSMAVGHDAITRYVGTRTAGDVARPVVSHAEPDDPVDTLAVRLAERETVTTIEVSGAVVGVIGPRQLQAQRTGRARQRCAELMVPLEKVQLLRSTEPASALLSVLGRHGFALVRTSDGLGYVESADLFERIAASMAPQARMPLDGGPNAAGPSLR